MPKTILFTFDNYQQRDEFLGYIKNTIVGQKDSPACAVNALNTVRLDPPIKTDSERTAALFVSGKKLTEGVLSDIHKRFDQETVAHSASVEIRELREGEWKTIRSRKLQK